MPTESILFSPEIDERELDKEVGTVNDRLESVGEDIGVSFDGDTDGLAPAGVGGGGGGVGAGGAAGAAGLASKIPKPVAGVTAAAALPIAITGAVGAGMLSAMRSSSARMQTSATILSQAWNNIWRPMGDKLDQLFIRDIATDILGSTERFEELFRSGFQGGLLPDSFAQAGDRLRAGAQLLDMIPGPKMGAFARGIRVSADVLEGIGNLSVPEWPGWPELPEFSWPELPNFRWPNLPNFRWPNIPAPKWPDIPTPEWPSAGQILNQFPTLSVSSVRDEIFGGANAGSPGDSGGGGGGGGGGFLDGLPGWVPGLQSGGRVQRTGVAEVHRGELVADPDRLVSELASAVSQATAGGARRRASMDTGRMEQKLDRLHDDLRRLESALSVEVQIGDETVARAASNGQRNGVADSNPRV